eukprot:m.202374 g.202374  ORF g.202374 m.202374 type:complete len:1086 (+) comp21954_c0_seq15:75-3332(+)
MPFPVVQQPETSAVARRPSYRRATKDGGGETAASKREFASADEEDPHVSTQEEYTADTISTRSINVDVVLSRADAGRGAVEEEEFQVDVDAVCGNGEFTALAAAPCAQTEHLLWRLLSGVAVFEDLLALRTELVQFFHNLRDPLAGNSYYRGDGQSLCETANWNTFAAQLSPELQQHPFLLDLAHQLGAQPLPQQLTILDVLAQLVLLGGRRLAYALKVRFVFDLLDTTGSGLLTAAEMVEFLQLASLHHSLRLDPTQLRVLADSLLEEASGKQGGAVDLAHFQMMVDSFPRLCRLFEGPEREVSTLVDDVDLGTGDVDYSQPLTADSTGLASAPGTTDTAEQQSAGLWKRFTSAVAELYLRDRRALYGLLVYILLNVGFFLIQFFAWEAKENAQELFGHCVSVARGSAQVISVNSFLILWPILRPVTSRLRRTWLHHIISFDVSISFHIIIAHVILLAAVVHTGAHVCDFYRAAHASPEKNTAVFRDVFKGETPSALQIFCTVPVITGIVMLLLLLAYPLAYLRRHHFRLFWYSHHALLAMLVLTIVHGTQCLLHVFPQSPWLIGVPLGVYGLEQTSRRLHRRTRILRAARKPGDVIELTLVKSPNMHPLAAQYVSLNIPALSLTEWHPFTLSSTPLDDFLRCHIRAVGPWTRRLLQLCDDINQHNAAQVCALLFMSRPARTAARLWMRKAGLDTPHRHRRRAWWWCLGRNSHQAGVGGGNGCGTGRKTSGHAGSGCCGCCGCFGGRSSRWRREHCTWEAVRAELQLSLRPYPMIFAHGPFGSPTQEFYKHKQMVMIAAGIGVTPMASVLRHLVQTSSPGHLQTNSGGGGSGNGSGNGSGSNTFNNNNNNHNRGNNNSSSIKSGSSGSGAVSVLQHKNSKLHTLDKVYFQWVTRDSTTFSWFSDVIDRLVEIDENNVVQISTHLTSSKRPKRILAGAPGSPGGADAHTDFGDDGVLDLSDTLLSALLDTARLVTLKHKQTCLVSGLHNKRLTSFGRPDWEMELLAIRNDLLASLPAPHKLPPVSDLQVTLSTWLGVNGDGSTSTPALEVPVFYCGPPSVGRKLGMACFRCSNSQVHFLYRPEIF